jgi:histidine triad (HIT) family protein
MSAGCPFCAIASGRAAAVRVLEERHAVAFLDHRPLFPGHALLVPRAHVETLVDLPEPDVAPLFASARRLAAALERGLGAQGSFVAINNRVSQSVPHLHVHVVPRTRGDGLRGFFWPRGKYASGEEMERVAERIREAL